MKPETLLSLHKKKDINTSHIDTQASTNSSKTIWTIRDKNGEGVRVKFKNKRRITQFEAVLLLSFFTGKKPNDYADYHKCIAGKEFFDSIKSITFLQKRVVSVKTITEDDSDE